MAIRFRCSTCNKLLQTADTTAGRQVKCPSCATVLTIPHESTVEAEGQAGPGPLGPPPTGRENPYVSPQATAQMASVGEGPAWEREGPSMGTFFTTIFDAYRNTDKFFSTMKRQGGFKLPLIFVTLATTFALLLFMGYYLIFYGLGFASMFVASLDEAGGVDQEAVGVIGGGFAILALLTLGFVVICVPLLAALQTTIQSGIMHLMLMLLGSAKQPYETTFRAVSYGYGAGIAFLAIPCCGVLASIPMLWFLIIGVARAHGISAWMSLLALLLPSIIWFVFVFAVSGVMSILLS